MSFAEGFLKAWKDNDAEAEREAIRQEAQETQAASIARADKNRQEDQEYRASRDATQDKNQLDTLLSSRMGVLITARDAYQASKKMPAGHKQNLIFLKDIIGDADSSGELMTKFNQSPKAAAELRATWTAGAKKGFEPRGEQLIEAIGVLAANEDDVNAYREWSEGADPVANLESIDLADTAAFYKSIAAYSGSRVRPESTLTYTDGDAFGWGAPTPEEKRAEIKIFDDEILIIARRKVADLMEGDGVTTNNIKIEELNNAIGEYKDDSTKLRNRFGQEAFDKLDGDEAFMYAEDIYQFNSYQGQDEPVAIPNVEQLPVQDRPPKPITEEEKSTLPIVSEVTDLSNIPPNSWFIAPSGNVAWKGNI